MPPTNPRIALVTIGTDGVVDYVQVPDGQKYMLGPVSVLKLISNLVPVRQMRAALNDFLTHQRVLVRADLDKMWELLPFQRARYSSTDPLISQGDRTPVEKDWAMQIKASYDTFANNMKLAEEIVAKVAATDETINRLVQAGNRFNSVRAKSDLHTIVSRVASIAQEVDMAQPWVSGDLLALSKQANAIYDLFPHEEV